MMKVTKRGKLDVETEELSREIGMLRDMIDNASIYDDAAQMKTRLGELEQQYARNRNAIDRRDGKESIQSGVMSTDWEQRDPWNLSQYRADESDRGVEAARGSESPLVTQARNDRPMYEKSNKKLGNRMWDLQTMQNMGDNSDKNKLEYDALAYMLGQNNEKLAEMEELDPTKVKYTSMSTDWSQRDPWNFSQLKADESDRGTREERKGESPLVTQAINDRAMYEKSNERILSELSKLENTGLHLTDRNVEYKALEYMLEQNNSKLALIDYILESPDPAAAYRLNPGEGYQSAIYDISEDPEEIAYLKAYYDEQVYNKKLRDAIARYGAEGNALTAQYNSAANVSQTDLMRAGVEAPDAEQYRQYQNRKGKIDYIVSALESQIGQNKIAGERREDSYRAYLIERDARKDPYYAPYKAAGKKTLTAQEAYDATPNKDSYGYFSVDVGNPVEFSFQNPDWQPRSEEIENPVRSEYLYMTDEQRDTYAYLLDARGKAAAQKYMDSIWRELTAKQQEAINEGLYEYCKDHKVVGTLINMASPVFKPIQMLGVIGQMTENIRTGRDRSIDPNAVTNFGYHLDQTSRAGVIDGLDPEQAAFLNGLMDAGQFGVTLAMPKSLRIAVLSSGNAAETATRISASGGSDEQALFAAVTVGVSEVILDDIKLADHIKFLNAGNVEKIQDELIRKFAKVGIDLSKKTLNKIAENVGDYAMNGEQSQYARLIRELMNQGQDSQQARENAFVEIFITNPVMESLIEKGLGK